MKKNSGFGDGFPMAVLPVAMLFYLPAAFAQSADASAPSADAPVTEIQSSSSAQQTLPVPVEEPARPGTKNRAVEEVVVTAQKRSENIRDVPISIQAFSGDALAARGISTTADLGQSIPSLQFTGVFGFSLIYIRGIGTDNFIPSADPSIAQYIDGIYVPQGQSTVNSLGNVERVEVLKGPQGTLFGRDATGGAISIVTEEPGDKLKANAEAEAGNYADRSFKLGLSGPVTNWLSAGISGVYSYENSYYTDVNYKTQPTVLGAGRVKLNLHPTENLSVGLTAYYSQQKGLGSLIGANTAPTDLGKAALITAAPDSYTVDSDFHAYSKAQQDIFYGNITWKLPWVDLKLLGSDQYLLNRSGADYDGSPMPIAAFEAPHEFVELQTGELQVISNDNTFLADRFKWVAGLYYLHSSAGVRPARLDAAPQALESAFSIGKISEPQALQDLLAKLPVQNTPLGSTGTAVDFTGVLGTDSYSAYAQGTFKLTNWLDLTLGGRYQSEKRFLTDSETSTNNPLGSGLIVLVPFTLKGTTSSSFSPKGVLSFHVAENELIYASYSVGYKSGTYNIVNLYVPPNYINPERVTSYELGAKVEFFRGLLRLNTAVFDNEIHDLQSGFVSLFSGGAVQFLTAPAARTRGAEFDGTLIPLPNLDDGLLLTANAAFVDGTYTDFPCGPGFNKTNGIYEKCLDLTGDRIVRSPRFSGGVGLVQTIDIGRGSIELAADEYYNSGFFYDAYNTAKENSYEVLNAHAGYAYKPWNARVTLFGKNLLAERYHIQQFQTDFGVIKTLAAPREYGIRLNWDF